MMSCPRGSNIWPTMVCPTPKGPRGEKRAADAINLAVLIGKIANGEVGDEGEALSSAAAKMGRAGGKEARGKYDC